MATVIFYNFILFSSTLFVYYSEKCKYSFDRRILLFVAFLIVFIPSAIRYDIGTDYLSYLSIYETGSYINYQFKEPAFYFINLFLDNIGAHSQWLFATLAFIFTAVVFKSYPKKNAWVLHFLFFVMLWFFSHNGIRQAIAIAFTMPAIYSFFEKNFFIFFILTIIGASFHQSALIIAVIGALALVPLGQAIKCRIAPLVFISTIIFTYFSISLALVYIEQVLDLAGFSRYTRYFSSSVHFIEKESGSGLGVLAKTLFASYIIFNTKDLLNQNKRYWLVIILAFAYALGVLLANRIIIFARMADTFVIAVIIGSLILLKSDKNKKYHKLILALFMAFLLASFIIGSFGKATGYSNPKRNPYKTIFEQ